MNAQTHSMGEEEDCLYISFLLRLNMEISREGRSYTLVQIQIKNVFINSSKTLNHTTIKNSSLNKFQILTFQISHFYELSLDFKRT